MVPICTVSLSYSDFSPDKVNHTHVHDGPQVRMKLPSSAAVVLSKLEGGGGGKDRARGVKERERGGEKSGEK